MVLMGIMINSSFFKSLLYKSFVAVLLIHLYPEGCLSLNLEGFALLEFREHVEDDPYGALENWNPNDIHPCNWTGVLCVDGRVEILNLKGQHLGGHLAPDLGKLEHLRAIILCKNRFSGSIPKEIGGLTMLEILDLRGNNFSGTFPMEIEKIPLLKCLLTCGNKLEGGSSACIGKPSILQNVEADHNLCCEQATGTECIKEKVDDGFKMKRGSSVSTKKARGISEDTDLHAVQSVYNSARRKLLEENKNLPAESVTTIPSIDHVPVPSTGSGSFPAVPRSLGEMGKEPKPPSKLTPQADTEPTGLTNTQDNQHPSSTGRKWWFYALVITGGILLLGAGACMLLMCRKKGVSTIGPWKTGLSGQLQKAFVTGVPKVNREELEAACEDFSNIVEDSSEYTVFKGTLSSGVEIAVVSTTASAKDWSKHSEMHFRKKIEMLSRINHKNFVNLLGYCEEDEPFMRMMIFEYTPNGTLFEHLHVKEFEHLDWSARVRIIMGIAYCLQYVHHEQDPPILHPDLQSTSIFITEDYAAKVADISIWKEVMLKEKMSGDDALDHSVGPFTDTQSNVYSFGILMLETISGRVPYTEEQGFLVDWAMEYLSNKNKMGYLIDPSLKSFNNEELDVICEVILDCVHQDPKKRPTMREVIAKFKVVIPISPEAAKPRLSPLWWAELEILSVEAS